MFSEKYEIRFCQDNELAVYLKGDYEGDYVFKGSLEEVNAWLGLKEKGFEI